MTSSRKARKPASLPMSEGNAGVKAYIASMEPWQAAIARRLDEIVTRRVPNVHKAVKWHTPLYGIEGNGFFLAFSGFQYHVNITFFRGSSLRPVPPRGAQKEARFLQVRESDELDERQLTAWVEQAAALPGWIPGKPL